MQVIDGPVQSYQCW